MTLDDWPTRTGARIASQMRRHRKARGMTAQELADACAAAGRPIARSVIANWESHRRATITVDELLVLAAALQVPPMALLFPLDSAELIERTPEQQVTPWEAVAWFTGETSVPVGPPPPEGTPEELLSTFRAHADAVTTALVSTRMATERRRKATVALDQEVHRRLRAAAEQYEQLAHDDCRALRAIRAGLRERGLQTSPLPAELAFIEDEAAGADPS